MRRTKKGVDNKSDMVKHSCTNEKDMENIILGYSTERKNFSYKKLGFLLGIITLSFTSDHQMIRLNLL